MKNLILIVLCILPIEVYCQTNYEKAKELKNKAIELMENGQIQESISLLNEAKALDPKNYLYEYEIGYAHYLNKDYKNSLKSFKKVIKYQNINDQCYQMLGNLYDINGNSSKAIKVYDDGLKTFPKSGKLFLEKGTLYLLQKEYNQALNYYEQGILNDPAFPSNYFRAAYIYLNTDEEVWGMIYGEIFMNLERYSERNTSASKMLFDTYTSEIKFISDTSFTVSFSKQSTIHIDANNIKKDMENFLKNFKISYGTGVYETTLLMSTIGQDTITLKSLNEIRTNFANNYYGEGKDGAKNKPMVLIDYQKKMMELGLFEAYNYWLLREGNAEEFNAWTETNPEKWKNFNDWFRENPIFINDENKFHSSKY